MCESRKNTHPGRDRHRRPPPRDRIEIADSERESWTPSDGHYSAHSDLKSSFLLSASRFAKEEKKLLDYSITGSGTHAGTDRTSPHGTRHSRARGQTESVTTDHRTGYSCTAVVACTNSVNISSSSAPRISACHSRCPATLVSIRADSRLVSRCPFGGLTVGLVV